MAAPEVSTTVDAPNEWHGEIVGEPEEPEEPEDVAALMETMRREAVEHDGPSANPFRLLRPDEQADALSMAETTRRNLTAQDAETTRPLTPVEQAQLAEIRTVAAIGQPLAEFLATEPGPVEWFGPIPEGGLAAVVGRPESFKSMAMVQLGLAGAAGGSWVGYELGEPRPFVYLSAEKSRATVRDRLARMTSAIRPSAPVRVIHRAGVSFGDRESWDRVVELVAEYGPRTFVVADTIASLAGPGFDENSGRDMASVLAALRRLGDAGATVAALHHPSKHGEGVGGIRLRGHTSLWGEVDATMEFTRPDRAVEAGILRCEPKDGDLRLMPFEWDRETFLVEPVAGIVALTVTTLAAIVEASYTGQPLTSDRIAVAFPGHGRTAFLDRLSDAVTAGLVARVGRGKSTGYTPVPRALKAADEWGFQPDGRNADEPAERRTNERATPGRKPDEGNARSIVRAGGSI